VDGEFYVFILHDTRALKRVVKAIERNRGQLLAVIVVASVAPHVAGGISQLAGKIEVKRGPLFVL
jgi:hypothetical protein